MTPVSEVPMPDSDRMTGYELVETATLVSFDIIEKEAQPSPDGEETCVWS